MEGVNKKGLPKHCRILSQTRNTHSFPWKPKESVPVGVQDHVTILKEGFGFTKFIYVINVKFEDAVGFSTTSSKNICKNDMLFKVWEAKQLIGYNNLLFTLGNFMSV